MSDAFEQARSLILEGGTDAGTHSVLLPGETTAVLWVPPEDLSAERWEEIGVALGRSSRAISWWIGDWWLFGERRYGDRKAIVTAPGWQGPSFQTCMNAAVVCQKFETYRRREALSFTHHAEVAALPGERADNILDRAEERVREGEDPPSTRDIRQEVKRERRAQRLDELAGATERAGERVGKQVYAIIYADPPWRFEPRSRVTGMDRSVENHYQTMGLDDIRTLRVPVAPNAILFLWATVPMLPEALDVLAAWGFIYRSHMVWTKPTAGTGYWFRNAHELLLVGVRGEVPAPAFGDQPLSWLEAPRGRHSEKPVEFAEMIEAMFPGAPRLEMFSRSPRPGWDVWGNEAEQTGEDGDAR